MTQIEIDIEPKKYEGPKHYFASCAFGWATAETRDAAIRKLVNAFHEEYKRSVPNAHKEGEPGSYLWSCEVHGPSDAKYSIEFYAPKGIHTADGRHHYVTYITKKSMNYWSTKTEA